MEFNTIQGKMAADIIKKLKTPTPAPLPLNTILITDKYSICLADVNTILIHKNEIDKIVNSINPTSKIYYLSDITFLTSLIQSIEYNLKPNIIYGIIENTNNNVIKERCTDVYTSINRNNNKFEIVARDFKNKKTYSYFIERKIYNIMDKSLTNTPSPSFIHKELLYENQNIYDYKYYLVSENGNTIITRLSPFLTDVKEGDNVLLIRMYKSVIDNPNTSLSTAKVIGEFSLDPYFKNTRLDRLPVIASLDLTYNKISKSTKEPAITNKLIFNSFNPRWIAPPHNYFYTLIGTVPIIDSKYQTKIIEDNEYLIYDTDLREGVRVTSINVVKYLLSNPSIKGIALYNGNNSALISTPEAIALITRYSFSNRNQLNRIEAILNSSPTPFLTQDEYSQFVNYSMYYNQNNQNNSNIINIENKCILLTLAYYKQIVK